MRLPKINDYEPDKNKRSTTHFISLIVDLYTYIKARRRQELEIRSALRALMDERIEEYQLYGGDETYDRNLLRAAKALTPKSVTKWEKRGNPKGR